MQVAAVNRVVFTKTDYLLYFDLLQHKYFLVKTADILHLKNRYFAFFSC